MVGGKVKEVVGLGDKLWINVGGTGADRGQQCAIHVRPTKNALLVRPGDAIWWQGRFAMWTPRSREREDVRIPRIGYSGVRRPRIGRA